MICGRRRLGGPVRRWFGSRRRRAPLRPIRSPKAASSMPSSRDSQLHLVTIAGSALTAPLRSREADTLPTPRAACKPVARRNARTAPTLCRGEVVAGLRAESLPSAALRHRQRNYRATAQILPTVQELRRPTTPMLRSWSLNSGAMAAFPSWHGQCTRRAQRRPQGRRRGTAAASGPWRSLWNRRALGGRFAPPRSGGTARRRDSQDIHSEAES